MRGLYVAAVLAFGAGAGRAADGPGEAGRLSIIGGAVVRAEPDVAYFTVAATTRAPTSAAAIGGNAAAVKKAVAGLAALGVKKGEVQTTAYGVHEVTHQEEMTADGRRVTRSVRDGYAARTDLRVTVCKLDDLGALLDAAAKEDGVEVGGVQFDSTRREQLLDDARAQAGKNAVAKANTLAGSLGVRVTGLVEAHEAASHESPQFGYVRGADGARPAAALQGGSLAFTATVTAVFQVNK